MKKPLTIGIIIAVFIIGAFVVYLNNKNNNMTGNQQTAKMQTAEDILTPSTKSFQLKEENKSAESGAAVLSEEKGKVKVVINMAGAPNGVAQPAHIHTGSCPNVGAVVYPLTDVVNGMSVTVLNVSMSELLGKLPLGINVHKSASESKVYVSCGDLKQ